MQTSTTLVARNSREAAAAGPPHTGSEVDKGEKGTFVIDGEVSAATQVRCPEGEGKLGGLMQTSAALDKRHLYYFSIQIPGIASPLGPHACRLLSSLLCVGGPWITFECQKLSNVYHCGKVSCACCMHLVCPMLLGQSM